MIIGTRGSELALKQAEIVIGLLGLKEHKIKIIKTKGDVSKEPLQKIGVGVFTKELDNALIKGEADIAIHSLKDIPVEDFPEELEIFVVKRDDARDCLIGRIFDKAVIGTDSVRRQYELVNHYKNIKFKPIRGNIPTRIKKLGNNEYNGIVIAKCALDRLGLGGISRIFSVSEMVPAAGQGAIAVVKRKKDKFDFVKESPLNDCCMLERKFIQDLGGCRKPVGAYCEFKGGKFNLAGLVYKGNKRVLVNLSGDNEEIADGIREWKEKHI